MSSRFDHVTYDPAHVEAQKEGQQLCLDLESFIDQMVPGRPKSLALTALEECYMWIGKAIRDDQLTFDRNQMDGHSGDDQGRKSTIGESDYPNRQRMAALKAKGE
jgi:hypothetical protein